MRIFFLGVSPQGTNSQYTRLRAVPSICQVPHTTPRTTQLLFYSRNTWETHFVITCKGFILPHNLSLSRSYCFPSATPARSPPPALPSPQQHHTLSQASATLPHYHLGSFPPSSSPSPWPPVAPPALTPPLPPSPSFPPPSPGLEPGPIPLSSAVACPGAFPRPTAPWPEARPPQPGPPPIPW